MVRSLMALVFRRVLAWLVWSDEHAKDLEIVVVPRQNLVRAAKWLTCQLESGENPNSMIILLVHVLRLLPSLCGGQRQLPLENLALR